MSGGGKKWVGILLWLNISSQKKDIANHMALEMKGVELDISVCRVYDVCAYAGVRVCLCELKQTF